MATKTPGGKGKGKKGKGGKQKRRGASKADEIGRALMLKEEQQEYGTIVRALGSGHFEVKCYDGKQRYIHLIMIFL